jgi:hypothetical protein
MKKVFVENLYSTNLITLEDHQEIIGLEDGILTTYSTALATRLALYENDGPTHAVVYDPFKEDFLQNPLYL